MQTWWTTRTNKLDLIDYVVLRLILVELLYKFPILLTYLYY